MAFEKTFTHPSGTDMSYWKISKVDTNYFTKSGTITIFGFISQASREAGNKPLGVKSYRFQNTETSPVFDNYFSITKINGSGKNPVKNAYDYLKSILDGEFSDAVDILE